MRHSTTSSCPAPSLPTISLPTEDPRDATFLARAIRSARSQVHDPSSSSSHKLCVSDTRLRSAANSGDDWYGRPTTSRAGYSSASYSSRLSSSRPSGSSSSHTRLHLYDHPTPSSSDHYYPYPPLTFAPVLRHVSLPPDTQLYPLPSPPSSPARPSSLSLPLSSSSSSSAAAAACYGAHQGHQGHHHHHQSHRDGSSSLTLHAGLTHLSYDVRRPPATARSLARRRDRDALHLDTHSRPFRHTTTSSSSSSSSSPLPLPFPHATYATSPPTRSLILSLGPYTISVYASSSSSSNNSVGRGAVTCGDVITALYQFLQQPLNPAELQTMEVSRSSVFATYWQRVADEQREKPRTTVGQDDRDTLRNVDALMGQTEVLRVVLRTGKRCAVETRKPDGY